MARTFGPTDVGKILNFLLEQLPENKLAELDAMLQANDDPYAAAADPDAAMDSAMGKRRFIGIGHNARNAIRDARANRIGMDSASLNSFGKMFPGVDRIGHL